MTKPKKSVGRPRIGKTVMRQIAIRLPDEMIADVDRIIEQRFGEGDRTAVIRELVAEALAARKALGPPTPRREKPLTIDREAMKVVEKATGRFSGLMKSLAKR